MVSPLTEDEPLEGPPISSHSPPKQTTYQITGRDITALTSSQVISVDERPVERVPKTLYPGEGTRETPFIVNWPTDDPENPYNWDRGKKKWPLTALVSELLFFIYGLTDRVDLS